MDSNGKIFELEGDEIISPHQGLIKVLANDVLRNSRLLKGVYINKFDNKYLLVRVEETDKIYNKRNNFMKTEAITHVNII